MADERTGGVPLRRASSVPLRRAPASSRRQELPLPVRARTRAPRPSRRDPVGAMRAAEARADAMRAAKARAEAAERRHAAALRAARSSVALTRLAQRRADEALRLSFDSPWVIGLAATAIGMTTATAVLALGMRQR